MTQTICIDIGQTGLRVRSDDGREASASWGAKHLAIPGAAAVIAEAVTGPVQQFTTGASLELLIGTTGYDPAGAEALMSELEKRMPFTRAVIANDLAVAHLTAHGTKAGITMIAGTGLIACTIVPGSAPKVLGGTGWLLGDVGGGYWIGAQGMLAALHDYEGRSASASLRAAAERHFGDLSSALANTYRSDSPVLRMASFAPLVAEAARDGDPTAQEIWHRAVEEGAETITAALAQTGATDLPVAVLGGIASQSDTYFDPLQRRLARNAIVAQHCAASPLDGCLLLQDPECEFLFPGLLTVRERSNAPLPVS